MKPTYAKTIALKLLSVLNTAGVNALCVGGCPRDTYHNMPVSDIDIVVSHEVDPDDLRSALTGVFDELPESTNSWTAELFTEYGDDDQLLGENNGDEFQATDDFRQRISWVYKFQFDTESETICVDILAAIDIGKNENLVSFLDTFDFTINQFAFDQDENWVNKQSPHYSVRPVDGLMRHPRVLQRYKRLSAKYPNYGWVAVEQFLNGKDGGQNG